MGTYMSIKSKIFKKRIIWWLNPWLIAIALLFILISIPMVLWIASYGDMMAVWMFVITYLSLLVFSFYYIKQTMLEPHLYVDEKEIEKQRKEIQTHRQQVHLNFLRKELEVLQRGDRTPVLDVWRLNPLLLKRHPYFQKIETVMLDPKSLELHIRIQIGEFQENDKNTEPFIKNTISFMASFIRIIVSDIYLQLLKRFFHILVIELYTRRQDENRRNVPYPILSLLFNETTLEQFTYVPSEDFKYLKDFGDIRFDGGCEITPHRGIESMVADSM
jgi:hypothetical protein